MQNYLYFGITFMICSDISIFAYRLEQEIQSYRDRLADAEYYKTRVTELREDNKALMETRDALEEQLQRARKRAEQCLTLEAAMIKLKREANDIALVSRE